MQSQTHEPSERLKSLPPYIFSQINEIKARALAQGKTLINLGIGDPDRPTPPEIVAQIKKASEVSANHMYSPYEGTLAFRQSAARWMKSRFGVDVDAEKEVTALIGSKEGIAHFPLSHCNPGDRVLYPSPGYPVFQTGLLLAGVTPVPMPLRAQNQFLPDPDEVENLIRENQPKYIILNFPSNPTSAFCSRDRLEALVDVARRNGTSILHDNAYSEIYFNDAEKPMSILEIPGAKDICIELHSFSKSYNMTGWRIGFATGNRELVQGLLKVKTHVDSGPLLSVQQACSFVLEDADRFSGPIRQVYKERSQALCKQLDAAGIEYLPSKGSLFIWAKVPGGMKSMDFTRHLIENRGLIVTPGIGFGEAGEGFFRMALTLEADKLSDIAKLLN